MCVAGTHAAAGDGACSKCQTGQYALMETDENGAIVSGATACAVCLTSYIKTVKSGTLKVDLETPSFARVD